MNKVSIIIPVIREEKVKDCIAAIKTNAGIPADDYEIIAEVDRDRIGCPTMVKRLTAKAKYDLVCFLGDDTLPQKDFLKNAIQHMNRFSDGWGLVSLSDNTGRLMATHWLAHKKLLSVLQDGEFFSTAYIHNFCDNELMDQCLETDRFKYASDAVVKHDHPLLNGEKFEDVYNIEEFESDRKTYWRRKAKRLNKFAIGLPLAGRLCDHQFWISLLVTEKPENSLILVPRIEIYEFQESIAAIRNDIVWQALSNGASKLIMMDTDQVYPSDVIMRLLSHDVPVVGAPVHRRYPPFDAIMYQGELHKYKLLPEEKIYSGELVEVDATGAGCICFDTSVFIDLEYPWFKIQHGENDEMVGEDIRLCSRLRKKGIKIYMDTSIAIDHLATFRVNKATREMYKAMMGETDNRSGANNN